MAVLPTLLNILLHLSGRNESGANKNNESEKAFVKTKEYVFGARIKICGRTNL